MVRYIEEYIINFFTNDYFLVTVKIFLHLILHHQGISFLKPEKISFSGIIIAGK